MSSCEETNNNASLFVEASAVGDRCAKESCDDEKEKPSGGLYIKARHVLTLMAFFARFNMYSMRSNLSVAIVVMVNSTKENTERNSSQICPDRGIIEAESVSGGNFTWSTAEQGLVLGCYYYGYLVSNVPGGYLAKKYGIRLVLGISMLLSSIITILTPFAVSVNFGLFVATRILLGLLHGLVSPSLHAAWGDWAPPLEVTKMLAISASGNSAGTLLAMPLAGIVAEKFGWEAVFYVTGGIALPWSLLWLGIIHDKPDDHPRISDEERSYIERTTGIVKKGPKLPTPWLSIVTSAPVWAIVAGQIAHLWGNSILLAMLPMYLSTVLRFNFATSGILSAVPYAIQLLVVLLMGYVSDTIRRRGMARTITVRKGNSFICLVLPSVFLVAAGYSGCDVVAATSFFCICVALSGCTATAHEINVVDIAPRYSGLCYGIVNAISYVPGFLAPQAAGLMLNNDPTISQWQKVFWMAAGINILGFLIFMIFASAREQTWSRRASRAGLFDTSKSGEKSSSRIPLENCSRNDEISEDCNSATSRLAVEEGDSEA